MYAEGLTYSGSRWAARTSMWRKRCACEVAAMGWLWPRDRPQWVYDDDARVKVASDKATLTRLKNLRPIAGPSANRAGLPTRHAAGDPKGKLGHTNARHRHSRAVGWGSNSFDKGGGVWVFAFPDELLQGYETARPHKRLILCRRALGT